MSMSTQDWKDLASVYRAGAACSRRRSMNVDRQQEAEVLEAQAARCEEIAAGRNSEGTAPREYENVRARVIIEATPGLDEVLEFEIPAGLSGDERAQAIIAEAEDTVNNERPWGAEEVAEP